MIQFAAYHIQRLPLPVESLYAHQIPMLLKRKEAKEYGNKKSLKVIIKLVILVW